MTPITNLGIARKAEYIAKIYKELSFLYKAIFIFDGFIALGKGIKLSDFLSDRMFKEIGDGYSYESMKKGFNENNKESEEEE